MHILLIDSAFDGLTNSARDSIKRGSALVDTYYGSGGAVKSRKVGGTVVGHLDIPITLRISEAYKHAMIPDGKTKKEAQQMASAWVANNLRDARDLAAKGDLEGSYEAFGKAMHTVMDATSPAHAWQIYGWPAILDVPFTGEKMLVVPTADDGPLAILKWLAQTYQWVKENQKHRKEEGLDKLTAELQAKLICSCE